MDDKNLKESNRITAKRLWIYLAFSFGLTWSVFFAFILAGFRWDMNSPLVPLVSLAMLCPAIAALLTRQVTREGFALVGDDSLLLGISFKNRKWIWYLVALLLPWLYIEAGNACTLLFSPEAFDLGNPARLEMAEENRVVIYLQPFFTIITSAMASFAALGEEAGWRAYMMPKMIKLWGVKKAIIFGGIIWGIWHWPLTYIGHNFGTEYWGYPFTGFAMMCIGPTCLGVVLTYITYKSGSIWPATILHAVNNASPSILQYFINREKITGWKADSIADFLISYLPVMILAGFVYIKFVRCKEIRGR